MKRVQWMWGVVVVLAMGLFGATGASAGAPLPNITVTATATCEGVVTATYSYPLAAGNVVTSGFVTFTVGITKTNVTLPDAGVFDVDTILSDDVSNGGYAVGDTVIVDAFYTDSVDGVVTGVATVTIPACPTTTTTTTTTTIAPVDTEVPDTEAPGVTEAPTETDAPTPTPVPGTQPPATLPATGSGSLPTGLVAGLLLVAGVAMVVFATRRQADGTSR